MVLVQVARARDTLKHEALSRPSRVSALQSIRRAPSRFEPPLACRRAQLPSRQNSRFWISSLASQLHPCRATHHPSCTPPETGAAMSLFRRRKEEQVEEREPEEVWDPMESAAGAPEAPALEEILSGSPNSGSTRRGKMSFFQAAKSVQERNRKKKEEVEIEPEDVWDPR